MNILIQYQPRLYISPMESNELKEQPDTKKILHFTHAKLASQTLTVSAGDTLMECRQYLDKKSQLYLFANYHFEMKGKRLLEIVPVKELIADHEATIDITFNAYDIRTAKYHLGRVMEIIRIPEIYIYLKKMHREEQLGNKQPESSDADKWVHEFPLHGVKPQLNCQFLKPKAQNIKVDLIHSISLSGFNPPPINERLSGDLFYVHIRTLELADVHVTASPYGFYVNQSKISHFNPNKSTVYKNTYANFLDLLKNISEKFRERLEELIESTQLTQGMKCKMLSLGKYRMVKWLDEPEAEHGWNSRKMLSDENIKIDLLSLKDWNELFQVNQKVKFAEERSELEHHTNLSKIYSEFELAAIEGAMCLVDGKISPLNPTDEKKRHIYIYNKIFFSIANETPYDHSQEKGDDATPSSSSINTDLINIRLLESLGIPELHVLHMIIISYRGFKIIAQGIIPGILSVDQINCSQYGSLDDGKTIETNPEFEKIMLQVCEKLGLEDSVKVKDGEGVIKTIAGSPDIKGILGTDQRKYILDLLRLSPRDLNYPGGENETCVIRPELIRSFRAMKAEKGEEVGKINTNIGTELNFVKEEHFLTQENLLKEIADYLKSVAVTNLIESIKRKPNQCLTDNANASKMFHEWGVNLRYLGLVARHELIKNDPHIKLFFRRIILIRSLKHLFRMAMRQTNIMHLSQVLVNLLNSIFGRAAHIIALEEAEKPENGEMDFNHNHGPEKQIGNQGKKKKKKKAKEIQTGEMEEGENFGLANTIVIPTSKYRTMKPTEIWLEVCKIAKARYDYEFECTSITELDLFRFPFQKAATLRDVCLSVGLIVERKNYDINEESFNMNDKIFPFTAKNIINIEPKAKKMKIDPPSLDEREQQAEKAIEKFQVKEVYAKDQVLEDEILKVWGGCNESLVRLYQRRSRILYILGDYKTAATLEELNLDILNSISCPDSALAIRSHQNLGIYYIGLGEKEKVIYHEKKSIYLMLMAFGETAPDLLVALVNLAKIYQMNKDYDRAVECYDVGIYFLEKVFGKNHIELSFCYSSLASICYEQGDLKRAIENQTETVGVLIQLLPEEDSRLKDAITILKTYRQMYQSGINQNTIAMKAPEPRKPEEEKPKRKHQNKR